MRELKESEIALASEILTERKPMYLGQKTWVNFQHIEAGELSFNPEPPPKEKMPVDMYSVEFVAERIQSGALVWVPAREISR